jgi:membrane protease YdiL (CAAX protease family)
MKYCKRILALIFVIALGEIIPYGFVKYITDYFGRYVLQTEPTGYFILALIHRGVQFILVLILIKLLFRDKLSNLGFNLKNKSLSRKIIAYVFIIWPLIIAAFFLFSGAFANGFSEYIHTLYPSGSGWMMTKLGRDILLLDAFAEEILYRLFVISYLGRYWTGSIRIGKWTISHATLLSVPIFVLAHISLNIYPFEVLGYDPMQLLLTAFTGLIFGLVYEKTRSLLAPIVIHGYTNLIITIAGYLTVFITS